MITALHTLVYAQDSEAVRRRAQTRPTWRCSAGERVPAA
jgi:hypothetical protein